MFSFPAQIDAFAGLGPASTAARLLDRTAFIFLIVMAAAAPHSIAATQSAWLIGMTAFVLRILFFGREGRPVSKIDIALFAFFAWTVVSSIFSYAPDISFGKLRAASLFLIVYFAAGMIRTRRAAYLVAGILIASCMVNVLLVPIERLIGRGVAVHGVVPGGALARADVKEGNTILAAGKQKVSSPDELIAVLEREGEVMMRVYTTDWEVRAPLRLSDLAAGSTAEERLGFETWKPSRNWRSAGFYGHFTTYAEVLQLLMSLVLGLAVAAFASRRRAGPAASRRLIGVFAGCFIFMSLALVLNVTRASQGGLIVSGLLIVLIGLGRKWVLVAVMIVVPIAGAALFALQQTREVGYFDSKDGSTTWRQTVWREAAHLWTDNPRNFVFGVGMDSIKRYAGEWRLFDNGRLPMGHFHSTPLQIAVERGAVALIIWLILIAIYASALLKAVRSPRVSAWPSRGILLGCLGGLAGFLVSGLVHYNLGDSEVAMIFYLLMGLSLTLIQIEQNQPVSRISQ